MHNGFSFKDAIKIAQTNQNITLVQQIQKDLEEGKEGDETFVQHLPSRYRGYFHGFIQYMTLKDTIHTVLAIQKAEKEQREELMKGLLYPSLLFIGVNIGLLMFNTFVFPVMIHMMQGFSYENQSIVLVQKTLGIFANIILFLLVIGISTLIVSLQQRNVVGTYHWVMKRKPDALLVKYASVDFSRFFLECLKKGMATKETLSILKNIEQKPLVQELAKQLDTLLDAGTSFSLATQMFHVESSLIRILQLAVYASNCCELMEGYLQMVKKRTANEIRMYGRIVQCISYSAVGLIVILVYQVLLMPIQMMQTL